MSRRFRVTKDGYAESPDQTIKKLERTWTASNIFLVCSMLFMVTIMGFIVAGYIDLTQDTISMQRTLLERTPPLQDELRVSFHDLNDTQVERSTAILSAVNPLFLQYQREIHFASDVEEYCGNDHLESGFFTVGCNTYGLAAIYIQYSDNESFMKDTLCHELLHTITYPVLDRDDPLHQIIYLLAGDGACYVESPAPRPITCVLMADSDISKGGSCALT